MLLDDKPLVLVTELDFALAFMKDDTEEDLVGSDVHQTAIRITYEGLQQAGPEQGLPWHISTQLMVRIGDVDGRPWQPSPDILVHPTAGLAPRTSFDVAVEGVPPFVLEVASPHTWRHDLSTKGPLYNFVGVQEYLIFDPTGDLLGTAVRAWHATPTGREPWLPEVDGRWHSAALGVSFQPQGLLLRVFDRQGVLMPTISEHARQAAEQARQAAELARRIAELEAENQRLRGEND